MKTHDQIVEKTQALAKLESRLARQKLKARKSETRHKIELGGLIVKAKLSQYPKSVILGLLLDAAEQLAAEPNQAKFWQSKGERAFLNLDDPR